MNSSQLLIPRLDNLVAYLRRGGWMQTQSQKLNAQIWTKGTDDADNPIRIVLPNMPEGSDSNLLIQKAVKLIAALDDTAPEDLAFRIAHRDSDVLRPRLIGRQVNGSVAWDLMTEILKGIGVLLAGAATQEADPRHSFDRVSRNGSEFLKKCRFGHTLNRSFGLTIECPIGLNPGDLFEGSREIEPAGIPFERRVTERLARGLLDLQQSIRSGDPKPLTTNIQAGFNANLCDALLEIVETVADLDLEISMLWSPEWTLRSPVAAFSTMKIERHAVEYLRAASRALRSEVGESRELEIVGTIIRLHSLTPPIESLGEEFGKDDEHTVLISRPVLGGRKPMIVKANLNAESYKIACDAHKEGARVAVWGWLEKPYRTSHYELKAPRDFRLRSD